MAPDYWERKIGPLKPPWRHAYHQSESSRTDLNLWGLPFVVQYGSTDIDPLNIAHSERGLARFAGRHDITMAPSTALQPKAVTQMSKDPYDRLLTEPCVPKMPLAVPIAFHSLLLVSIEPLPGILDLIF
jgi:hypothetical protein